MIYPTRFAVLLMAFGAPVCALLAVLRSELWSLGLVWIAAGGVLVLLDALMCASGRRLAVALATPEGLSLGRSGQVRIDPGLGRRGPGRPRRGL